MKQGATWLFDKGNKPERFFCPCSLYTETLKHGMGELTR